MRAPEGDVNGGVDVAGEEAERIPGMAKMARPTRKAMASKAGLDFKDVAGGVFVGH